MGMPEFVRRRLPYMAPLATPDSEVMRVIPPLTGAWVEELNREQGGGAAVFMNGRSPVTSDDRILQVTGITAGAGGTEFFLLAWEGGFGVEPSRYRVVAMGGGETLPGRVVAARAVAMPTQVKRELMAAGYIKPASEVVWLAVAFDAPVSVKRPVVLQVDYDGAEEKASSAVRLFAE
jgi:hypothetical protein